LRLESKTTIIHYIILSVRYYVYTRRHYNTHNCARVHCVPIHNIIIVIRDRARCVGEGVCAIGTGCTRMTQRATVTGREFDGLINIENSGGRAVAANNPPWRCNLRLTAGASGKPVARGRCLEIVLFRHVTGFSGTIGQTGRWLL